MKRLVLAALALSACHSAELDTPPVAPQPSTYQALVAPLLAQRCIGCHGPERAKGRLRLDTPEGILAGGSSGPALVAGHVAESELVRRLRLPLADEEHMPPEDKPQLDPLERSLLEGWIAAGAPFEGRVESLHAAQSARMDLAPATEALEPADPEALARLRSELVHVQRISADSPGLWVDFAAIAPRADDTLVTGLLEPLRGCVVDVSLARSAVGDGTLALCARLPHLARLDLRDTKVGDDSIRSLSSCANLRELVLARTAITDMTVDVLLGMPRLERVFLWGCQLSPEGLARLRARTGLAVEAGDTPDTVIAELEPPPKFSSDLPSPDAPPPGDPSAPVNASCPVTGSPVNPKYTRTFEGRVIGFCCPNCPKEFDKDPAGWAEKALAGIDSTPKSP